MMAELLTQSPLRSNRWNLHAKLTKEELSYLSKAAQHHFDHVTTILRRMPTSLILVIRNINTIRSIARSHGDPVDRYVVMARSAAEGAFVNENGGLVASIASVTARVHFELMLMWSSVKVRLLRLVLWITTVLSSDELFCNNPLLR